MEGAIAKIKRIEFSMEDAIAKIKRIEFYVFPEFQNLFM